MGMDALLCSLSPKRLAMIEEDPEVLSELIEARHDSEIPGLVGEPLDGLLFTCVGVPEYRSKAGGPPGAPSEIRMVQPRLEDD